MKKLIPFLSLLILTGPLLQGTVKAEIEFTDIDCKSWYYECVNELVELGIINGFPDGTFRPDEPLSADQFIKMAVTALGIPMVNGTNYWASTYIEYADEIGLLDNTDIDNYKNPLPRGEIVCIISKALDILNENIEIKACGLYDLYGYTPVEYIPHVLKVYNAGIMIGYPDNTFRYEKYINRAEACAVIHKLVTPINRRERQITSLTPVPVCYSYIEDEITEKINEYESNKGCFLADGIVSDGHNVLSTDFYNQINSAAIETMKLLYDNISYPVFSFGTTGDKNIFFADCFSDVALSHDRTYAMFSFALFDAPTGYTEKHWGYDSMFAKLEINRLASVGLLNGETGRPDAYYEYKIRGLMRLLFGEASGDVFSDFIISRYIEYAGYNAGEIPAVQELVSIDGIKMIFFSEGEGRQLNFTFSED